MKRKEILFGYDFNLSNIVSQFRVQANKIGLESQATLLDTGATTGTSYLLSGINANMAKMLRSGDAYLEFWIEAIDHTRPTANNKLYPADIFKAGLECRSFQNQLRLGGVSGEAEHPMIQMYDENPNSQRNIYNNLARVNYVDPNNVSHSIIAYNCTPEKTYFKIRTNPGNPIIVNDILSGKMPAFSIRTRGDFENRDDGVIVATGLEVITIDYVRNPANAASIAVPDMKAISVGDQKELELQLLPKTGTESIGFESILREGDKLIYDETATGLESIGNMRIIRYEEDSKEESFDKLFFNEMRSFL